MVIGGYFWVCSPNWGDCGRGLNVLSRWWHSGQKAWLFSCFLASKRPIILSWTYWQAERDALLITINKNYSKFGQKQKVEGGGLILQCYMEMHAHPRIVQLLVFNSWLDRGVSWATVHRVAKSRTQLSDETAASCYWLKVPDLSYKLSCRTVFSWDGNYFWSL